MDANRFDQLAQRMGLAPSRRSVLGLAAAAVVAWLTGDAGMPAADAAAKRGAKERRRRKDHNDRSGRRNENPARGTRREPRDGAAPARSDRQNRGAAGGDDKGTPAGGPSCALQFYDKKKAGSRFEGPRKMQHDVEFFADLDKVNGCAAGAGVYLETGSSYRDAEKNKKVNPKSTSSNHIAGHALDFKFLVPKPGATYTYGNPSTYDTWGWIDITTCKKVSPPGTDCSRGLGPLSQPESRYPQPVREFIACVRQTPGITWGGDHPTCCGGQFDPIHVDDRLNESNRKAYTQVKDYRDRVDAVVASGPCPSGTTCDTKTGLCVQPCDPPCTDGRECRNDQCECPGILADCGGVCTNTTGNDAHCGECGNDCTVFDEHCCGAACIDTDTAPDHCGACGNRCQTDGCCDGTCTDLQATDEHCGLCGNDCTLDLEACCDGGCVDTESDPEHCGGCGRPCGDQDCCDGNCKDLETDDEHCGECGNDCTVLGERCCGGSCVDLQTDNEHCGSCGEDCTLEPCQMCLGGQCRSCSDGYTCCNGACVANCATGTKLDTNTCKCLVHQCEGATQSCGAPAGARCSANNPACVCRSGAGGSICANNYRTTCSGSATRPGCSTTGCGSGYRCVRVNTSCCPSGEACAGFCAS